MDGSAPEFGLMRRVAARVERTMQAAFQPYLPVPSSQRAVVEDPVHGLVEEYSCIVKLRKYKLCVDPATSAWVGRTLQIELADWESGEVIHTHLCSALPPGRGRAAKTFHPFMQWDTFCSAVDALGETEGFSMDTCRCFRHGVFELRVRDAATGERPPGTLRIALVPASYAARVEAEAAGQRGLGNAPGPRLWTPKRSAREQGPAEKRPRVGSCIPLLESESSSSPDPASPQSLPSGSGSPPPKALVAPSDALAPSAPEACGIDPWREKFAFEMVSSIDAFLSAFGPSRSEPAPKSSLAEALAAIESKFWRTFVSKETRRLTFRRPSDEEQAGRSTPHSEDDQRSGGTASPDVVDELFVKLSNLTIDTAPPAPAALAGPPSPPLAPPAPAPGPPAGFPVHFSPSPYVLAPHEADDFMRRVSEAEAAGAGSALAVLLGDPRILGTELFRTLAGRIRTRHLLQLVRTSRGPSGSSRSLGLAPLTVDAVLRSLTFNVLASPSSYGTLAEAERACENVWNLATVCTSDYCLISPDLTLLPFDQIMELQTKAREVAEAAVERFGRTPQAEMLETAAKAQRAFSLRQHGYLRESLELNFEAWDALLRLRVYPHRLESLVLRELCELHVQLERTDLGRHFSEKLYWFEETDDDVEFKISCTQSLAYVLWQEGSPAEAAKLYAAACDLGHALAERSGNNPAYMLRTARCYKSRAICELASGSITGWAKCMYAGSKLIDATCELTSGEHDDFGLAATGIVFRPSGFKLCHAIRIAKTSSAHLEWGQQRYRTPHKVANARYHIGLLCAIDGQYEEALRAFEEAEARYTCTPELAACFGPTHPRLVGLRRAAAWVAARLGRPAAPAPPPARRPRPGPALEAGLWWERGIGGALQEAILSTYPADAVQQIAAWLANGPR